MTQDYGYFKSTEGTKRLSNTMDFLGCFREGIDRVQLYLDKKSKYLEADDRVKLGNYLVNLDEIYWKQFHKFIDQVQHFREV